MKTKTKENKNKNENRKKKKEKTKTKKLKTKKVAKTKNRRGGPSHFAIGSIWWMEQSNRQSAGLKTMLAQVNTLNSLPFLNMNPKLYFYFHVRFIVLLKG